VVKRALIRFALGTVLGAVIAGAGFRAAPAFGYNLMGPKWNTNTVQYDKHTLSSSWQTVATFGASQWTNVSPSPFTWVSNNNSNNDITRAAIDGGGGTLAVTTVWYSGGIISRANIKFDSAENWYVGSSTPGSSQIDARAVSAHEFGHGAGIGHSSSGGCSSCPNRYTMCASYIVGSTCQRSLEADDRNALNALYP
jgi:hypothetical protein